MNELSLVRALRFTGHRVESNTWRTMLFLAVVANLVSLTNTLFGQAGPLRLAHEEQALLAALDQESQATIIEAARRLNELRQAVEDVRRIVHTIESTADEAEDTERAHYTQLEKFFGVIGKVTTLAALASRLGDEGIGLQEALSMITAQLNELDSEVEDLRFDAEDLEDTEEGELRSDILDFLRFDTARELLAEAEVVLKWIEKLKNPAQFAKDFADREISQWLAEPREAGGITFKILKTDPSKSLFSPEADIVIQMEYGPGIVVEAHGLYFKYVDAAPHFEAVLDQEKMKLTTNLQALGQAQVTKAANELLATIDGPVTVKNFEFTDFGTSKAGLKCRVEVNLGEFLPLKAGGNVLLATDGKLKWAGALDMTYPCNPPIPVGSTPLGIHDIHGAWNPEVKKAKGSDRQLKVGTIMSTVASQTDEVVALDVNVAFDFPVKAVDIDGKVTLGRTSIGDVRGTLDLSKTEADAEFKIPGQGSAIPESVFAMTGKTKITREGLDSVGNARLFGKDLDKSHLFIGTDGHGSFTAESCQVCGVNLAPNLEAGFTPGFSDVWARAVYSVDVDLRLFRADATVMIEASKDHGIQVTARAMGSEAVFSVESLDQITPERIAEELLKHMDDMLQNIAAAAAKWEADKKELLAKWDSHWRESLHDEAKKHKLDKVDTGNPAVNQILGGISSDAKWSGGVVSDVWKKSGAEASNFVKDPAASLSSLPSNFGRELSSGLESATQTIGNLLGGGGGGSGGGGSSRPDPAKERAKELHAKVEEKLTPLVQACNAVHLAKKTESRPERSRERYFSETSEISVQFENAVGASRGKGSGLVGLTVAANGYRSRIHHGRESNVDQQDASDVKGASIDFTSLVPQDKADLSANEKQGSPKARIHVDQLADASGLNAQRRTHAKLQELIEKYLPEVEIEGPKMYYESQLAVENRTKEPIHVWVQTYTRALTNGTLAWNWSPANPPAREAHRITIKPGTTETLQIVSTYNATEGDSTTDLAFATSKPLAGSRVRLWVESESGERWMTHFDKDLWLVPPDPGMEETRGYFADQIRTYTHVIEPKSGTRIFDERLVMMTNKTKEPLKVQLRYRATEGGETAWRTANDLTIPPGGSEFPKTSEGMRVRASQVQFSARSDHLFFGAYSQNILPLVGGADGQRLYHADKIGQFEHVFESPVVKSQGSK